jgi:hypothetical protein
MLPLTCDFERGTYDCGQPQPAPGDSATGRSKLGGMLLRIRPLSTTKARCYEFETRDTNSRRLVRIFCAAKPSAPQKKPRWITSGPIFLSLSFCQPINREYKRVVRFGAVVGEASSRSINARRRLSGQILTNPSFRCPPAAARVFAGNWRVADGSAELCRA